jgi:hypothetical protein
MPRELAWALPAPADLFSHLVQRITSSLDEVIPPESKDDFMVINSIDDLRPGDIMIAGQSAAPAKLVVYAGQLLLHEQFRIGDLVAGHAGVVVPGGNLVEAMPHGARFRRLTPEDWSPQHAYLRLPEGYPGQALDAASVAVAMVGTPYSIASYIYLAAYLGGFKLKWLAKRINRRDPKWLALPSGRRPTADLPLEAICSVLAEQAWTITGKKIIEGTAPQVVTPGMLAQHLWDRPGVIKGGAGILQAALD